MANGQAIVMCVVGARRVGAGLVACLAFACAGTSAPSPGAATTTTVKSDDGRAELTIPSTANVDASSITLTARPASSLGPRVKFGYVAKPDGLQFAVPAMLTWTGPEATLGVKRGARSVKVSVGALQTKATGGKGEVIDGQVVTLVLKSRTVRVEAPVTHFSEFDYMEDPDQEGGEEEDEEEEVEFGTADDLEEPQGPVDWPFAPVPFAAVTYNGLVGTPRRLLAGTIGHAGDGITIAVGTGPGGILDAANPLRVLDGPTFRVPAGMQGKHAVTASLKMELGGKTVRYGLETAVDFTTCEAVAPGTGSAQAGAAILANLGQPFDTGCVRHVATGIQDANVHSNGTSTKPSDAPHTDTQAQAITPAAFAFAMFFAIFAESLYHCGDGPNALTLCPSPATLAGPGDFVVVSHVLAGAIPKADPVNHYVYGFVFDADGKGDNNYKAPANFPKDFYDDTDRWYEAGYVPGKGWALTAKDARNGSIQPVATAARIVLRGNALVLVVPKGEFTVDKPGWRTTAFRHKGDYGLKPPHEWSGDVEPPVGKPLAGWP